MAKRTSTIILALGAKNIRKFETTIWDLVAVGCSHNLSLDDSLPENLVTVLQASEIKDNGGNTLDCGEDATCVDLLSHSLASPGKGTSFALVFGGEQYMFSQEVWRQAQKHGITPVSSVGELVALKDKVGFQSQGKRAVVVHNPQTMRDILTPFGAQ